MKEETPAEEEFKDRARPFPFIVLALSLLFTAWAAYYVGALNRTKNLTRFTNATLETEGTIRDSLNTYTALLRGGAGLFAANSGVTRDAFHAFYQRLRVSDFYPGLFGFGFAKRVLPGEELELETRMRREGQADFHIWPRHPGDSFPIIYLEPLNWRNERAIGYDMFSEPVRHAAMMEAIDSGFAISGKVTLVQETGTNQQPGFLMYVAIYSTGAIPETETARRQSVAGFVYSPFRAGVFFNQIFKGGRKLPTSFEVYDGKSVDEENLLHRSRNSGAKTPRFSVTNQLFIAERTWTLVHRTTPEFEKTLDRANMFWVGLVGTVTSFLLFGFTFFLSKSRRRAERSEWELLRERERLRASEELHRMIAETAADAIITIDEQSRIITANRATEEIFGYSISELVGKDLALLIPERMRTPYREGLEKFLKTGEKVISWSGVEFPGLHKNGREIPLEISFGQTERRGKRIFTGVIRDIRERKKAEQEILKLNRDLERRVAERTAELQDANHQMEAFVYSIAHDLRAPLRAMRGFAHALREDYATVFDSEGLDYANRIIASAKFMDELINDLLAFSRVDRAELNFSALDLNRILDEVRQQLAPELEEKHAIIEVPERLPCIQGHEAILRQVLINLLSNAIKFVAKGVHPKIVIRVEDAGKRWRIWIEDNGIGIAPQHLKRIFGIFERLHGSAYPGTGIGLAIVRKGIERMNGRVGVESEPGKGSRFWLEIPKANS